MDPVTLGAVLLAVATGVSEALGGRQLWAGVVTLVRRPRHGGKEPAGELPGAGSGESELTALQRAPADQARAVALAEVLLGRACADPGFERALRGWWEQAAPGRRTSSSAARSSADGSGLSLFFDATASSVAVITAPLPLNHKGLSDRCRKHR